MIVSVAGRLGLGFSRQSLRHPVCRRLDGRLLEAECLCSAAAAGTLQQTVTIHLEQTGNTVAFNTVDLVARVEGFLNAIKYQDGAEVKKGDVLFVIEQPPYQCSRRTRR